MKRFVFWRSDENPGQINASCRDCDYRIEFLPVNHTIDGERIAEACDTHDCLRDK